MLGDQLDAASSALEGFEPATDGPWMAEVANESEHVSSSNPRTALFLSAMRHFAEDLRPRGWLLDYVHLDDEGNRATLGAELEAAVALRRATRASAVTSPMRCPRRAGRAPLAGVDGSIRKVLEWREYVRGIYGAHMPGYLKMNALDAHEPLPGFDSTGDTPMGCMRAAISQTFEYVRAHHIQRLMVTGLHACLHGVEPARVHEWYLAVYVDAVEWAELPDTLGMSQHADGGLMASQPDVATGKYIQRMSNYCEACRFDPAARTGDDACPFTTLYWDFLARHRQRLRKNPRMIMQADAHVTSPDESTFRDITVLRRITWVLERPVAL